MLLQAGGDLTQLGGRAGALDPQRAAPGDDGGAHIDVRIDGLGHRLALAGQDGFIGRDLRALHEHAIARHLLARAQHDQVPGDELPNLNLLPLARANHGGRRL